jgi:hypothetical protein
MRLGDRKQLMALLIVRSPVTIDAMERKGLLPPRIRVSANRVRWDLDRVEQMLRERPTGIGVQLEPGDEVA